MHSTGQTHLGAVRYSSYLCSFLFSFPSSLFLFCFFNNYCFLSWWCPGTQVNSNIVTVPEIHKYYHLFFNLAPCSLFLVRIVVKLNILYFPLAYNAYRAFVFFLKKNFMGVVHKTPKAILNCSGSVESNRLSELNLFQVQLYVLVRASEKALVEEMKSRDLTHFPNLTL